MTTTYSPKVQEIADIIESHGCTINGKLISLNSIPELYDQLNDVEQDEIVDLILFLHNQRGEIEADIDYAKNEISSLDPDLEDELEANRSDLEFAQRSLELINPAIEILEQLTE